jgi:hypothetical protein
MLLLDVVFDDVGEADMKLDSMQNGQGHREDLKRKLAATAASRGGYVYGVGRGGRGGSMSRGGFNSR